MYCRGEDHWNAKLSEHDVKVIRSLRETGFQSGWLATRYGVTSGNISHIEHKRTWKHVQTRRR